MNANILKAVGLVSGGVAAGSTCTYFLVNGRLKKKYAAQADEEIVSVKKRYALLRKEGEFADPTTALEAYKENVAELKYAAEEASAEAQEALIEERIQDRADEQKEVLRNVFDSAQAKRLSDALNSRDFETADQIVSMHEAESLDERVEETERFDTLSARDAESPFHIPKDDFFDDSNEFDKLTITYYEGDNTLTDERDVPIRDIEGTVGRANMNRFGQASDDANIVYIRNERLRTDFEVIRDPEEYTSAVLGIQTEGDERPSRPRIRKMRNDE